MRVAKTEGFHNFVSSVPGEKSYGAFQLNISKNPNKPSLGDMFMKQTGLDPSDPKNERATIDFALKYASTSGRGWADWYGARNNGISQFSGIGARTSASIAASGAGSTTTDNSSKSETKIQNLNLTLPGVHDAPSMIKELEKHSSFTGQANTSLTG
jgi:hypothetical protein